MELLQIRELLRLLRVLAPALGNPLRPETDNPNAARSEFARGSDETGSSFSLSPRVLRRRRSISHSPAAIPPAVDAFHREALAGGGKDNGRPGLRPQYHAAYYGAFVLDPDGNNIEAVCHDAR